MSASASSRHLRLGVNIDHVATIRNARGGGHPDPVRAAKQAAQAGADGITAHLREDRRHISDKDIDRLVGEIDLPLNLEMAATDEMLAIALRHKPHAACIVPEKRTEVTTEGGLDAARLKDELMRYTQELGAAGIRVSLFIEPEAAQLEAAVALGAKLISKARRSHGPLNRGSAKSSPHRPPQTRRGYSHSGVSGGEIFTPAAAVKPYKPQSHRARLLARPPMLPAA